MRTRLLSWGACLGLLGLLLGGSSAQTQEPDQPPAGQRADDGMEVQTRGPIHEAYADPVVGQPKATPLVEKKPPPAIDELPPDQKPEGENVQWMAGYWAWDEDASDFLWISGFWRNMPPGRTWTPGYWQQAEGGWQWVPGFWGEAQQREVEYLPPPPAPVEAAPSTPAPGEDSVYIAGNWVYRETRYFWQPGVWVTPEPGWVWSPARYVWCPSGYVFVNGFWDYAFARRGLLFAPVFFNRPLWNQPNWFYRPNYCVYPSALYGSMFVRPDRGCYFFGDYFGDRYQRRGFVPWCDYRVGRNGQDSLYGYYRWQNRGNPGWDRDVRNLYADRNAGRAPRPPRTLIQQNTVNQRIQNVTKNTTINETDIRNLNIVAPITNIKNSSQVKLTQINEQTQVALRKSARDSHDISNKRAQIERDEVKKDRGPKGNGNGKDDDNGPPRRVTLPQVTQVKNEEGKGPKQPAPPPLPKFQRPKDKDDGPPKKDNPLNPKGKDDGPPKKDNPLNPKGKEDGPPPKPKDFDPKGKDDGPPKKDNPLIPKGKEDGPPPKPKDVTPKGKDDGPPKKDNPLNPKGKEDGPPPKPKDVMPKGKDDGSPKKDNPLIPKGKEDGPPPKPKDNPPPKKDNPPPPKKDNPPMPKGREDGPPPKPKDNPPPKKDNPPAKKDNPPAPKGRDVAPPPKKDNPPAPKGKDRGERRMEILDPQFQSRSASPGVKAASPPRNLDPRPAPRPQPRLAAPEMRNNPAPKAAPAARNVQPAPRPQPRPAQALKNVPAPKPAPAMSNPKPAVRPESRNVARPRSSPAVKPAAAPNPPAKGGKGKK